MTDNETNALIEQSRASQPAPAEQQDNRSALRRWGDAFLDHMAPNSAIFSGFAAAAKTPGYQSGELARRAADAANEAKSMYAAEEAANTIIGQRITNARKQVDLDQARRENEEWVADTDNRRAQQAARTKLMQQQTQINDENLYNAKFVKNLNTATLNARSMLNSIPEYSKLQSTEAQNEVLNSEEFREYTAFRAMGELADEAVADLIDGKADSEAGRMMEELAHSVGCRFEIADGEIYLVNEKTGMRQPVNEKTLKVYGESVINQIQEKCRKAQSTDPSFCGGFAPGETNMAVCNAWVAAGLPIDQAREQVRKYYEVLQASPKEKDMFEMNTALKHVMSVAQDSGKDIFNPNDVASMSSRDQSTLLSIIGTPAQGDTPATGLCKYGVEIRPKQDNSGYVVYDPNHFFSARDSFDARELPAILQREDSFGAMVNREIQSAQEARFLAMSRATAKASGRILRGEPSYGEEGDNQEQDKSKLSKEDRKHLMSMAGDTAMEWDDNQFRNYKDMLDVLYANAEAAGVTDGERRLVVTEENKDKLKRMAEVERGMIKARKLKGVRPIFEPIVEAIKEKDLAEEGLALYAEMFAEQRKKEEEKKQNSKSIQRVVRPLSR